MSALFVEESALFQKPNCGLRREFIGSKFANADQIPKTLGLLGLRQLEERIEAVNFTLGRWLTVLRKRFELSLDEFAKGAILKTVDDGACTEVCHEEHTAARHNASGFVHFPDQCSLFH